jgi:hypothetical protein
MKAIVEVAITKPGGGVESARKETEIDFVPIAGMQFEDNSVWDRPVKVKYVCYRIESKELFITLENHGAENLQDQESLLKRYRKQGWKIL